MNLDTTQIPDSPAVLDKKKQKIYCVINKTKLHKWYMTSMKSKKNISKELPKPAWRLLACPWRCPLVVFDDGTHAWASDVTDVSGDVTENATGVFCHASHENDVTTLVTVFQQATSYEATITKLYKDDTVPAISKRRFTLTQGFLPSSFSVLRDDLLPTLYVLSKQGELVVVRFGEREGAESEVLHRFESSVTAQSQITVLDENFIVVSGLKKIGQEDLGFGFWDMSYNILKAWRPFPEEVTTPQQILEHSGKLYVPCDSALFEVGFSLPSSSLGSALGHMKGIVYETEGLMRYWVAPVKALCDPKETNTHAKFSQEFSFAMTEMDKERIPMFVIANTYMAKLVQRCVSETKFWPREELVTLIKKRLVPATMCGPVLSAAVERADPALLLLALRCLPDVPEAAVVRAIDFFLSCSVESLEEAGEKEAVSSDDAPLPEPLTRPHLTVLSSLFARPVTDVQVLEGLRTLSLERSVLLLQYLHYLLNVTSANPNAGENRTGPNLMQVVDWLSAVLDTHFVQLVMSPDVHKLLLDLHALVEAQMSFYEELVSLEGILCSLKEKCDPPPVNVGAYCIQTLLVK